MKLSELAILCLQVIKDHGDLDIGVWEGSYGHTSSKFKDQTVDISVNNHAGQVSACVTID